jgi:trimethylamine:corrinoid methyltransferase-like protein
VKPSASAVEFAIYNLLILSHNACLCKFPGCSYGPNPNRNVTVGDGVPVFAPAYGAPFPVDYETGKRATTLEDYENLMRLAHVLPNQDMSGHLMVEPGDAPAGAALLHKLKANLVHSDKPFIGSAEGKTGARHTMEMVSILFGEDRVNQYGIDENDKGGIMLELGVYPQGI